MRVFVEVLDNHDPVSVVVAQCGNRRALTSRSPQRRLMAPTLVAGTLLVGHASENVLRHLMCSAGRGGAPQAETRKLTCGDEICAR